MHKVPKFVFVALAVATGSIFLFSAYTKLFPTIQAFEYNIASQAHVHYLTASILARFFIGIEAGLGSLMIFHYFGKNNWVLKAAFALLTAFSIYLIWLWIKAGNEVNCGCFGNNIWMSPSTSLVKNGLLMVLIWILIRYHKGFSLAWSNFVPIAHMVCAFSLAFLMNPFFKPYKLDLSPVYADIKNAPAIDLSKGKHIITFASPGCSHCRRAAAIMHQMKARNPTLPFYLVIGDTAVQLNDFWAATGAEDIPHTRLADDPFDKITDGEYPQIMWINNGMVEANTTPSELDQKTIEQWMK